MSNPRRDEQVTVWKPRTALGQMVIENKVRFMKMVCVFKNLK